MDNKKSIGDSVHEKKLEALIDDIAKLEVDQSKIKKEDLEIFEDFNATQILYAICFLKIIQKEDDFDIIKRLKLSSSFYKLMIKTLKENEIVNKINILNAEYQDSLGLTITEEKAYMIMMFFLKGYDYIIYNYSDASGEDREALSTFIKACSPGFRIKDIEEDINKNIDKVNEIVKIFNANIGKWAKSKNQTILMILALSDDLINASHGLIGQIQTLFFQIDSKDMLIDDLMEFLHQNNLIGKFDKFCQERNDED